MESQWWYGNNDLKVGPFSLTELVKQYGDGKANVDTLVWKTGWAEWQKLGDIEELRTEVQAVLREQHRSGPPPLPTVPIGVQQPTLAELKDLAPRSFFLRAGVLFGGYTLFALLTKGNGNLFYAIGQALGVAIGATFLFLIVWGGKRLFGRRMKTPLRDAFMLGVFMVALGAVSTIIVLRVS